MKNNLYEKLNKYYMGNLWNDCRLQLDNANFSYAQMWSKINIHEVIHIKLCVRIENEKQFERNK